MNGVEWVFWHLILGTVRSSLYDLFTLWYELFTFLKDELSEICYSLKPVSSEKT